MDKQVAFVTTSTFLNVLNIIYLHQNLLVHFHCVSRSGYCTQKTQSKGWMACYHVTYYVNIQHQTYAKLLDSFVKHFDGAAPKLLQENCASAEEDPSLM